MPMFLHLFRKNPQHRMTVKQLTHILKPRFSDSGSNSRTLEENVYKEFVKYLREVASESIYILFFTKKNTSICV